MVREARQPACDGVPTVREADKVKDRRNRLRMVIETLQIIDRGELRPTRIMYASNLDYGLLTKILDRLEERGFVSRRPAKENEFRKDKRTRVYVEVTEEGKQLLRDLEALDRRTGGILLEW